MRHFLAGLLAAILLSSAFANAQTRIPARKLAEDFAIARQALEALHPGLYRYQDKASMDRAFAKLEREIGSDLTLAESYLAFSRLTAQIRCGHTYCNFWNQPDSVKKEIFDRADKVPFTFRIAGHRMLVTRNVSPDTRLDGKIEILSIGGTPVRDVLATLLPLVKGDGSNDAARLAALELSGLGEFEAFDVYFPLVHPPKNGRYTLAARDLDTKKTFTTTVETTSRAGRFAAIEKRFGPQASKADDLWAFTMLDDRTAYLKLGTFTVWKMKLDWKAFLANAFGEATTKGATSLILDIRGNAGGADEVLSELGKYLLWKPARVPGRKQLLRYEKVPENLLPHLSTWDDSFKDRTGSVIPAGNGFHTWKDASVDDVDLPKSPMAFEGRVYLLVDATNSSATFTLAALLKRNQLATLVGQPTGGNRRGITGGQIFFLTLPNSGIEIDIPLIGGFPLSDEPDAGIAPDVYVKPDAGNILRGVDTELEAVKRLIERGKNARPAAP